MADPKNPRDEGKPEDEEEQTGPGLSDVTPADEAPEMVRGEDDKAPAPE
jgi:hypothetical protein